MPAFEPWFEVKTQRKQRHSVITVCDFGDPDRVPLAIEPGIEPAFAPIRAHCADALLAGIVGSVVRVGSIEPHLTDRTYVASRRPGLRDRPCPVQGNGENLACFAELRYHAYERSRGVGQQREWRSF